MSSGTCACGGMCRSAIPADTAGFETYLRETLKRPGIAVVAEGSEGFWIYVPKVVT